MRVYCVATVADLQRRLRLRFVRTANAVEFAVLGSADWYSCGLLHCGEDSARTARNSDELPSTLGNSCACQPDGAACGLDRKRFLDCFFVAGMRRRQLFRLQNVDAEVADFPQRNARKGYVPPR